MEEFSGESGRWFPTCGRSLGVNDDTDRDEGDKDLSCYGVGDNVMGNLCRLVCAYDLKLSSKVLVKSLHR